MAGRQYQVAWRLKLAARILGFGSTSFVLTFLIGETAPEFMAVGGEAITVAEVLIGVITGIALAGCILSWWREKISGILLLVSAGLCGSNIPPLPPLIPGNMDVWLMIGLPRLVAGVFLIAAARISSRAHFPGNSPPAAAVL